MSDAEKPSLYSDGIDPVLRSSADELFVVTFEVRPEPGSEEDGKSGDAFATCWVDVDDLRTAERRAVELIQEAGWRIHRFDAWSIVTEATYEDLEPSDDGGPDLRELLAQAFIDGEICMFDIWPVDAPDASDAD